MPRKLHFRLQIPFLLSIMLASLALGRSSIATAQLQQSPAQSPAVRNRRAGVPPASTRVTRATPQPTTVTCGSGTNNWTGTAGDKNWATASNWSQGAVPVSTDNVCTPSSFTSTITIPSLAATNQAIASLNSGAPLSFTSGPLAIAGAATFAGDLSVGGGTLTLNGTTSMVTLEMTAGTLSGTGTLTVSGLLTWSGGTESGSGVTNANGGMTISGEPFLDTRTLNNVKTATWTGAEFLMLNGSTFNNQSGGTWNHQSDSQIAFDGGTTAAIFNNAGTFMKSAGTNSNGGGVGGGIVFNNTGGVQANSGLLLVGDAGSCGSTCAGTWSVAGGDTLQIGSGATAAALSGPISGAGTVNFNSGTVNYTGAYNVTGSTESSGGAVSFNVPATVTSTGPITITSGTLNFSTGKTISTTSLTQSAGTLTGSDTVNVSGTLTWSGGTESGSGVTNANGGMTISGEPFLDTRTLNNAKTASWTGAEFLMLNGSTFNNQSGATWNHQSDSQIAFDGGTTAAIFNNAGTFMKSTGTNSNGGGVGGGIVFNNTGGVQANSGLLLVGDAGSCGSTCAGTWSVAGGVTLQIGSGATAAALSGPISGAGTVNFNSGTVNYTGTYNVTGGTGGTGGTVNFNVPATVTSTGPITITGGTLNFSAGKTISTTSLTQSAGTLTGSDTVNFSKLLTWSGGTESGSGVTNANGGMTISGEPFLDTRTLTNAKTATWTGIEFLMLNGSVFNNKTGAIWNHQGDTLIASDGGTEPTFNNAGTFEKTSGTGSGGGVSSNITFNNSGTVIAKVGTLLLGNKFTQTKGSTLLEGGNISMSGSATLTEQGGSVLGSGTITGGLTNTAGLLSPSLLSPHVTTGALAVSGSGLGYYTQGVGGTVLFNIAGSGAGQVDQLNLAGVATLSGTISPCLINGFKPAIGTTFPLMSYASETGSFSTVQFGWSVALGATSAVATYNGAPSDVFSPTALTFPSQLINTTSSAMTETLKNVGQVPLTITSVTLGGSNSNNFAITSNTCSSTLAVGASCTIAATFTPSALGKRMATITVVDNACGSPHVIALSGKGTEITLAPSPVSFGSQTVGTTSAPMTVTVTNHGTTAVKFSGASVSGADKADFKIMSNNCTTVAGSGGTCQITITFTPGASGARTATLSVTDADKGSPQTDVLQGTGS